MAYLRISNVKISGMSACVPKTVDEVSDFSLFDDNGVAFTKTTGISRRRKSDTDICSSDLCLKSAENLISSLGWDKKDISALIFVTQSPDYQIPATSPLLQYKLGLNKDCYTLDISLGCSGWVYGMSVISSLLQNMGAGSKSLLLAGDTILKFCSEMDKSTYPLFGDAGTATALEYDESADDLFFNMNSDGGGYDAIIIHDGGYRNPYNKKSLDVHTREEGISSNSTQLILDGMDVFAFGIKSAPKSVNRLIEHFKLNKDDVDYFLFHQANLFMNEKIRKKLNIPEEKVPYSLSDFGNTSCATIPLTMVVKLREKLECSSLSHIACGFGVGLSWGSFHFKTDHIVVPKLIEL